MHVVADFNGDTHPDVITRQRKQHAGASDHAAAADERRDRHADTGARFSLPFEGTLDRGGHRSRRRSGSRHHHRGRPDTPRNDGQANFGAAETIIAGMAGWPTFGDFNGDNRTDVAVALGTPGVAVAPGERQRRLPARRSFTPSPAVRTAWPILPTSTATAASTSSSSRETTNEPSAGRERGVRRWRRRFRRRGPGHRQTSCTSRRWPT